MGKDSKEPKKASQEWLTTYGDMITLMLCFFVMLYNPTEIDAVQMAALTASLHGDPNAGGQSLAAGRLADLGNTVTSLPSIEKGKSLGLAVKKAVSLYAPKVKSNRITITSDERGLVITLAADSFFKQGSAEIELEEVREDLQHLAKFLSEPDLSSKKFRIEGHTDSSPINPGVWASNWELSSARAINILHELVKFGVNEKQFAVAGYADTRPKFSNETEEGRAYNRRVDIIFLDEGHF